MAHKYSYWPLAVFMAIVIVAASGAGAYLYYHSKLSPTKPLLSVELGDNVTVNYVGYFGSGPQAGAIFDTSLWSVANNSNLKKSLEFANRGSQAAYTPLGVHVGPTAPSGGYVVHNTTFNTVITGFWKGMLGMTGNVSKWISIPPSLGYGNGQAGCYQSSPLVYTIPATNLIALSTFHTQYPNATAATGAQFADPQYGWTDFVLSANASWVVVQYHPTLGQLASPYGYPEQVTNISTASGGAGTITLTSLLAPSQAGLVLGKLPSSASTVCSANKFIVSSISPATNTQVWNFNAEVMGQTLVFVVTVLNIYPGPSHTGGSSGSGGY
ncbi:MAG TPA: hypothetical protein VMV28_01550 [Thermoplasmata archaeon]|nr:hypothetical protein [Thermoplasmata archaeon]